MLYLLFLGQEYVTCTGSGAICMLHVPIYLGQYLYMLHVLILGKYQHMLYLTLEKYFCVINVLIFKKYLSILMLYEHIQCQYYYSCYL